MLATGNPEQLQGRSMEAFPWLKSRLAPLRVSELRDTAKPRADQREDAAAWSHLGIGAVLIIGYFIEGRPAEEVVRTLRARGIMAAPRAGWVRA